MIKGLIGRVNFWSQFTEPIVVKQRSRGKMELATSGSITRIFDYRPYLGAGQPKRALLSYLTAPIVEELISGHPSQFSIKCIVLSIPRALNELGYVVDIIDWTDTEFEPNKPYDLYVQHGGANFEEVFGKLPSPHPALVYFSSGLYWKLHNRNEQKRFEDFYKHHNIHLKPDRYIDFPEEEATRQADGVIALGSQFAANTYKGYDLVLPINNAAYPVKERSNKKDFAAARQNYLFFSGAGNVHKGLGLLLEVFKSREEHLYIMSELDDDFAEYYKHELFELPNIHYLTLVPMRSKQFYEVADICAFSILPSCAEGQAGSVVETMAHGLIPIVTKEVALEDASYVLTLKNDELDTIAAMITFASSQGPDYLEKLSAENVKATKLIHSPDYFVTTFKKHLQTVIGSVAK